MSTRGARGSRPKPARGISRAVEVGDLVFLRYPTERDRVEFLRLRRANRAYFEPWEPIPGPGLNLYDDSGFDRELESRRCALSERLLICRRTDGVLVGRLSLNGIVHGIQQTCHFGYWTGEDHAGHGFTSEAVRLGLRHAFVTLELHRVEINMQPHNHASRAVAQKAGLSKEGFSPKYLKIRGEWADHERWGITVEQWRGVRVGAGGRVGYADAIPGFHLMLHPMLGR